MRQAVRNERQEAREQAAAIEADRRVAEAAEDALEERGARQEAERVLAELEAVLPPSPKP